VVSECGLLVNLLVKLHSGVLEVYWRLMDDE
jgi:hypothetical protein